MSPLAKKFNQLPYFIETFWINISSATTGTNFVYIDHHLSELWKKTKKGPFDETPCNYISVVTVCSVDQLLSSNENVQYNTVVK